MSQQVVVHDPVHEKAQELAEQREITIKEAIRDVFKEAEYNV
jgi:hypothetical protein